MTDNSLSDQEKRTILHALGLNRRARWSHRNYCYGEDETCNRLVALGYMVRRPPGQAGSLFPGTFYHVTDRGIETVGVGRKVRNEDKLETYLPLPQAVL